MTTHIYFDGSYREQTGEMYSAIVCEEYENIEFESSDGTSSGHAEWIAALAALEYAADLKLKDIVLVGDASTVIDQMQQPERLKRNEGDRNPKLVEYQKYAERICREIGPVGWERIKSDDNPAGELLRRAHAAGKLRPRGLLG